MSKRNDRREAERLARREAYLNRVNQPSQTQQLLEAAAPIVPEAELTPEPLPQIAKSKSAASPAQYAANKANAQLSTGPVTAKGRAISARNHTSHGLTIDLSNTHGAFKVLPCEDQSQYDRQLAATKAEWKPATATEHDLVERMVTHGWLQRRARRLQDELLAQGMHELADKRFEVFSRYHNTHMRAFNKAFSDLMRLRNFQLRIKKDEAALERRAQEAQIRFESQKRKAEEHAAKMETLRLKQEAQKQRNSRLKLTEINAPATETTPISQAA